MSMSVAATSGFYSGMHDGSLLIFLGAWAIVGILVLVVKVMISSLYPDKKNKKINADIDSINTIDSNTKSKKLSINNLNKEYIFYKNNEIAIKLTKDYIFYDIYFKSNTVDFNDIISIDLVLTISQATGSLKMLIIKTSSGFKHTLYLNSIENVKKLFHILNELYSDKIIKALDYNKYKIFLKKEEKFSSIGMYSAVIIFALFAGILLYIAIWSGLRSQSYEYQYTSYDENKTLTIKETKSLLCPKIFHIINSTNNINILNYRYECLIGRNLIVLYESNLTKDEVSDYNFDKNHISKKEIFFYLIN